MRHSLESVYRYFVGPHLWPLAILGLPFLWWMWSDWETAPGQDDEWLLFAFVVMPVIGLIFFFSRAITYRTAGTLGPVAALLIFGAPVNLVFRS